MSKFRIWRHDAETVYADIEAKDEDEAWDHIADGDENLEWISNRYNADYEIEEITDDRTD